MTPECTIEFRQNGDTLDVDVEAVAPDPIGRRSKQLARARLQLNAAHMEQLRGGDPRPEVVSQVTAEISRWLLHNDLDLPMLLNLDSDPPPKWRLVYSVERIRDEALRYSISELPLELVEMPGSAVPLALHRAVRAVVHRLPKMGAPAATVAARSWPFRVLIVRANPADLGGRVPPADFVRQEIWKAAGMQNPGAPDPLVHVDVLSSEQAQGLAGKPTVAQFARQVVRPYDMLIYVGHGNLQPSPTGGPDLGVLLLESEDALKSNHLDARRLSMLLNSNPIPVVLLVGCLTAAQNGPDDLDGQVHGWIRGSHGVAQALVNGQSGVQFVVGMRFKVNDADATQFIVEFFASLLGGSDPGDLEAALHRARRHLNVINGSPIGWAAPVAFRTRGDEPSFPHFATRPVAAPIALDPRTDKFRANLWQFLAETSWRVRGEGSLDTRIRATLDQIEAEYVGPLLPQAGVLMPERAEVDPTTLAIGAPKRVEVFVRLHSPLKAQSIDAQIVTSTGTLVSVEATPALGAAGVACLASAPDGGRIHLLLRAPNPVDLPIGPIVKVTLEVPSDTPAVHVLSLEGLQASPPAQVVALTNAVIVAVP